MFISIVVNKYARQWAEVVKYLPRSRGEDGSRLECIIADRNHEEQSKANKNM